MVKNTLNIIVKYICAFRRKAEEDRIRKEEEKARRELIKQEYLKKKQQELSEEQTEQPKPKPKPKPKKQRPKSVLKEELSTNTLPKTTPPSKLVFLFVFLACKREPLLNSLCI